MKILDKYIIKTYLSYFFSITLFISFIIITLSYFDWSGKFAECNMGFVESINFAFMYSVPTIKELFPLFVLLTTIICFGLMNSNNEITALKSSGVSKFTIIKPLMMIMFFMIIFLFLFLEFFVPSIKKKTNYIKDTKMYNRELKKIETNDIWVKEKNIIAYIKYYNPVRKSFVSAKINVLDDTFKLKSKMFVSKGVYKEKDKWIFYDLIEQKFNKKGEIEFATFDKKKEIEIKLTPSNLKNNIASLDEMGFLELIKAIKKNKSIGYNITPFTIDLFSKIAFIFIPLILSVIGISLAIKISLKGKVIMVVIFGLIITFIYWVLNSFFLALSRGEVIDPVVATFTPLVAFFILSIFIFAKSD